MQEQNVNYTQGLSDFDWESLTSEKYNSKVKLSKQDIKARTKILCKEPYAQELYDKYRAFEKSSGISLHAQKDLIVNQIYTVTATAISFGDDVIKTIEKNSGIEINIPFKEYSGNLDDLRQGKNITFKILLTRATEDCEYTGSEKKSRSINYREELISHLEQNTWFEVTIKKLIKGGYIATYKDEIECFIPGSQAGANVIKDFSVLLGETINVMVDNYDKSNDLFIVSYKKYIKHSLPEKVSDLRFGKMYTGTLTTKPYDFGVFVELEKYYTGLVHSSDFENYDEIKKSLKAGDDIDVYVKGVSYKKHKNEYRIVLSLKKDEIPEDLIQWDNLKEQIEGKVLEFSIPNNRSNTIEAHFNGESIEINLSNEYKNVDLKGYSGVMIHSVNPLTKSINYSLVA